MKGPDSDNVVIALAAGFGSALIVLTVTYFLAIFFFGIIPEPGPGEDGIYGWNTEFRGNYPFFLSIAFSLTFGFAVAAFVIDPKLSSKTEALICFVAFAAMLGVSTINFAVEDALLSRGKQAIIDVLVVLFGAATLLNVSRWMPTRSISIAAKSLFIFMVGAFGILVPLSYFSLYSLDQMGMPIPGADEDDSWIKILSALISGVAGFLSFLQGSKKAKGQS